MILDEVACAKDEVGGLCENRKPKNLIYHAADLSLTSGATTTMFFLHNNMRQCLRQIHLNGRWWSRS